MSIILKKYVAYYRVSTKKQGRSGLGLEAQQKAVHAMAEYSRIARDHYSDVIVRKMKEWREEGKSLDEIAALLNADGFTTRRDRKP